MLHAKWGPYHHGMTRLQLAGGGEGLQIWKVAGNILNMPSRTVDEEWSSSLEVGRTLTTTYRKKSSMLRKITEGLRLSRIIWWCGVTLNLQISVRGFLTSCISP
jgi:hypothetical protein